jgi:hypothetical protein
MPKPQTERRRQFIVNRELQLKIILSVSLPMLVILLIVVGIQLALDHGVRAGTIAVDATIFGIPERIVSVVLFFLFATLFYVMFALNVSHRVAGASYRLSETLKAFQRGDQKVRARLRDGDLHFELADDINAFLDWVESRDAANVAYSEKADPGAGDPSEEPAGIATS